MSDTVRTKEALITGSRSDAPTDAGRQETGERRKATLLPRHLLLVLIHRRFILANNASLPVLPDQNAHHRAIVA